MTSTERVNKWRKDLSPEKREELRKKNAERAKAAYHASSEVKERQQSNFKKSYNEKPEFRAKVVRSASTGRYHMTPTEYDAQLKEQEGHCALCPSTDGDAGRRLHIDHDHACCDGKARACGECNRGLLCGPCNRRLAAVEDVLKMGSVVPNKGTWLERALNYLDSYRD
jgi:hypothetical protein